jgi:hypothetical protein
MDASGLAEKFAGQTEWLTCSTMENSQAKWCGIPATIRLAAILLISALAQEWKTFRIWSQRDALAAEVLPLKGRRTAIQN